MPCKRLFLFFLLVCVSPFVNATPSSQPLLPSKMLGSLLIPRLDKTFQGFAKKHFKNIPANATGSLKQVQPFIKMFFPGFSELKEHELLEKIPQLLQSLGLDLTRPVGFFGFKQGREIYTIGSLGIQSKVLFSRFQNNFLFQLQRTILDKHTERIDLILNPLANPKKMFLGLVREEQFYALLPLERGRQMADYETKAVSLASTFLQQFQNPFQYAAQHLMLQPQKARIAKQEVDILLSVDATKIPKLSQFLSPDFLSLIGLELSLQDRVSLRNTVLSGTKLQPFLAVHKNVPDLFLRWGKILPSNVAYFTSLSLDLEQLAQWKKTLYSFLPPRAADKWERTLSGEQHKDLEALLQFLRNQFSGHVLVSTLWDSKWIHRLFDGNLYNGDLENFVALVGLNATQDSTTAFSMVQKLLRKMVKLNPKMQRVLGKVSFQPTKWGTIDLMKIQVPRMKTLYLFTKGTYLGFAGSHATMGKIIHSWKSSENFHKAVSQKPALWKELTKHSTIAFLEPLFANQMAKQYLDKTDHKDLTPEVKVLIMKLLNQYNFLTFSNRNRVKDNVFQSLIQLVEKPKESDSHFGKVLDHLKKVQTIDTLPTSKQSIASQPSSTKADPNEIYPSQWKLCMGLLGAPLALIHLPYTALFMGTFAFSRKKF